MPRKPINPFFQQLGRELIRGLVDVGNRAATSAVRSVTKDGKKLAKKVEAKMREVEERCNDFIGDDEIDDEDPLDDPPAPVTRTRKRPR